MSILKAALTRRRFLRYAVYGAALLASAKGAYNASVHGLTLKRVDIRIKALPVDFAGFRIALLSDLHSSAIVSDGLIREAASIVMRERPDAVFLLGDYVTGETKFFHSSIGGFDLERLEKCVGALAGLKAPYGIYGVMGNHDMWSGEAAVKAITAAFEEKLGVKWLRNGSVELKKGGSRIYVAGIDDYWEGGSIVKAYKGLPRDGVRLLLSHNPDVNEELDLFKERADVVFSGHTHGGQVYLPFIGAPFMPSKFGQKYIAGLVADGERLTYTTRGIGTLLLPVRINAPPEAAIATLLN